MLDAGKIQHGRHHQCVTDLLEDERAARLWPLPGASTDSRDRLVVELLARAGMWVGELVALEADAVVQIGGNDRLRIALGRLRNDRYVPDDHSWSRCSSSGTQTTLNTSAPMRGPSLITAARLTGIRSAASSTASAPLPASRGCNGTGWAHPWPPG